jgi:hypothetical protein
MPDPTSVNARFSLAILQAAQRHGARVPIAQQNWRTRFRVRFSAGVVRPRRCLHVKHSQAGEDGCEDVLASSLK